MKMKLLLIVIILLAYGCEGVINTGSIQEIQDRNSKIKIAKKNGEKWADDPLSIISKFFVISYSSDEININLLKLNKGERSTMLEITYKEKSNSIEDKASWTKGIIYMVEKDSVWQFVNKKPNP
jgi:hypothetical protein